MLRTWPSFTLLLFFAACSANDARTQTNGTETSGTTGEVHGDQCLPMCSSDTDCAIMGIDMGWICTENACGLRPLCTTNDECVAKESGWTAGEPCTAGGGECAANMQVCLEIDGEGHCAIAPTDALNCEELHMVEMSVPDIDGNDVAVCGKPNATCTEKGVCFAPCTSNDECSSSAYPSCNIDTGYCECTSDADCQTFVPNSVCNAGSCGCGSDQDCIDSLRGDMCVEGQCRCSNDQACGEPIPFDGATYSCVEN